MSKVSLGRIDQEAVRMDVEARIKDGIKALLEEVMEEELTGFLCASPGERTAARVGERNGHYARNLTTGSGHLDQIKVPRDRGGEFQTDVFQNYHRNTANVEESVLEMYLNGVSTRKIASVTESLTGKRVGKDAVTRITEKMQEHVKEWQSRPLTKRYPYLSLDATYVKARFGEVVKDLAMLVAIGVDERGYREVLSLSSALGETKEAYCDALRDLQDRGLKGITLVTSDDHKSIQSAVKSELGAVPWQRCTVHFARNILSHICQEEKSDFAAELKPILNARRRETSLSLLEGLKARYSDKKYSKAIKCLCDGLDDALRFQDYPGIHHRLIRTTNMLERLNREIKRRTKVVGVFPNEQSALTLTTAVAIRVSDDWSLRRYMDMSVTGDGS